MIIYIVTFFIIISISVIIQKAKKISSTVTVFLSIILILLVAVVSGCRNNNIGTDISTYALRIFETSRRSSSIRSAILQNENTEILYVLLNYIVSRFTENFHVFLGVIAAIESGLVIYSAIKNEKVSVPMVILVYCVFIFNEAFNLIRQSLSIAIIIFGINYLKENKFLKYIITVLIAMGMHIMAFCGFIIMGIYYFSSIKKNKYAIIGIILVTTILTFAYNNILTFFLTKGILPLKYSAFIARDTAYFDIKFTFIRLSIILFILIFDYKDFFKNINTKNDDTLFFVILMIIDVILFQLGAFSYYGYRISQYFGIHAYIYLIPRIVQKKKKNPTEYLALVMVFTIIFVFFWYVRYVIQDFGETYPYESTILNIERK